MAAKKIAKKKPARKAVKSPAKKPVKKAAKKAAKKPLSKPMPKPARKPVKKQAAARKPQPAARKVVKKQQAARKHIVPHYEGKLVGEITHYFPKVRAAVLKLKIPLAVGDRIRVKGHTSDFTQTVSSIQIEHAALAVAKTGDVIGLLVDSRCRIGDIVTKV